MIRENGKGNKMFAYSFEYKKSIALGKWTNSNIMPWFS